jgi:hypothetical protein
VGKPNRKIVAASGLGKLGYVASCVPSHRSRAHRMLPTRARNEAAPHTALIALLTVVLTGCVTPPPLPSPRLYEQPAQAREALLKRSDPDSLAAAAMMYSDPPMKAMEPAEKLALVERASKRAPRRADLALLSLQVCMQTPGCDPGPLEAQLLAVDPSNGLSRLGPLSRAVATGTGAERDKALTALARATNFDYYENTLHSRLATAVFKTKLVNPGLGFTVVSNGLTRAQTIDFGAVAHSCGADNLKREDILNSCRKIAKALQSSDGIIMELIGDSLTMALYEPYSPEARAAGESRRLLQYSMSVNRPSKDVSPEATYRTVQRMAKYPRQQDSLAAEITDAGRDT